MAGLLLGVLTTLAMQIDYIMQ